MGSNCTTRRRSVMEHPPPKSNTSRHINNESFSEYPVYICKYDYDSRTNDDLSFKRGDIMNIISADEGGWWFAHSEQSRENGYIPSNYMAESNSLDAEDWFFGKLKCSEAETVLMNDSNIAGSFLVRESESNPGDFTLSIRDQCRVRHYPIQYGFLESGVFFVTEVASFDSIPGLVAHHRCHVDGLCRVLTVPCVIPEKPQTIGLSKKTNEDWDIDRKQLRFVKKLGVGTFVVNWEGLWNESVPVTIKTLDPLRTGNVSPSEFLEEITNIRNLRHPKILQLYAVCTKQEPIMLVTELMKYASLLDFLHGDGRSLKHPQLVNMATQVASGMDYLEEQNQVHKQLAAKNISVGENLVCKVSCLCLDRVVDEDFYKLKDTQLLIKWTAPEAILFNNFTTKSDVWSFGIVLYEIITYGRLPYPGMVSSSILPEVSSGSYRMPCPRECPIKLHAIMLDCWRQEPADRPSFKNLHYQLEDFIAELNKT